LRKITRKRIWLVLLLTFITTVLEFLNSLAANIGSSLLQNDPGRLGPFVRHPFLAGAGIIVLIAIVGVFMWRYLEKESATAGLDIPKEIERATEALAVKLRNQALDWEASHMIDRPVPLPVQWDNAPDHLSASWSAINRNSDNASPIALDGNIGQIAEIFARVPSGRLVVLGGRGSGKTVIASHFMLSMLPKVGTDPVDMPIPVLFSMASWDPDKKQFKTWLTEELVGVDPTLDRLMPSGNKLAYELLDRGRIFPILDGLDEMASSVRAAALDALSDSLRHDDKVLVTSRLAEYSAAVQQVGPLAEAAAIVIDDLDVTDLNEYFGAVRLAVQRDSWSFVLGRLAAAETGSSAAALREVLKTPLMVFMARTVYRAPTADPKDLLTIGDANAIRAELFRQFVPSVYDEGPGTRATQRSHNRVIKAERYLRTLATQLVDIGAVNFRWWQLHQGLSRRDRTFLGITVSTAATGLLSLIVRPFGAETSILDGLSLGILLGCLTGFAISRPAFLGRRPSPVPVRVRGRRGARIVAGSPAPSILARGSTRGFAWRFGLLVGVVNGIVWAIGTAAWEFINVAVSTAIPIALATWLAARLAQAVEEPVNLAQALGPLDLLRSDRSVAALEALVYGLVAAIIGAIVTPILGLVISQVGHPERLLHMGNLDLTTAEIINLAGLPLIETPVIVVFVLLFLFTSWGRFVLARLCFAMTLQLPWRLMAFLDDAHRRGILRRAGAVYQFRHVEIRNSLARKSSQAGRSAEKSTSAGPR